MPDRFLTHSAWRGYRRAGFPTEAWRVEADVLHARGDGETVSLVSRERYGDFDLSLNWRLPEGGNSGVLYRVSESAEDPWQSGPEMQLLHDDGHPDGRVPETSCGALYGLCAPHGVPPCPAGMYNVARITVRGSCVEHWLNGVLVLRADVASETFRAAVARSKFRACPRFARESEGHIVLQHHGGDAWFYGVRIERIGGAAPGA